MNIGLLWDIENVTPPAGMNLIRSIIEAISIDGRLSYAMAFGDWNNSNISRIAKEMASCNFELIHTPHGRKNSTDMSLIAHGVELIFQYPNIERFVLVSGDGDFRPLLLTQKKHGKETWVVCDVNNSASEDLIKMADHSIDYRGIIKEATSSSKRRAFELFREAVELMIKSGKKPDPGGVKSRMKILSPRFNEKALGYGSWPAFVKDAQEAAQIVCKNGLFEFAQKKETAMPCGYVTAKNIRFDWPLRGNTDNS
jgi:hypothetical protein